MLDWNDLRYFLAVAETGSTRAAGKALRVSQTTAARRIAALEETLGLALFERRQSGYRLTANGEALLDKARSVSGAAAEFADAAAAQTRHVSGTVRLTMSDMYAVTLMSSILRKLRDAYPQILIEIDNSDEVRDLAAGAADIALRSSKAAPAGAGLVGRRVADEMWTLYGSQAYAAEHGIPRNRVQLRDHVFVGGGGSRIWPPYRTWLEHFDLEDRVAVHHGSAAGMLSALRSGHGLAVLPTLIGESDPELIRCLPPRSDDAMELWLLTHEHIRHVPRIRAVLDFLGKELKRIAIEAEAEIRNAA